MLAAQLNLLAGTEKARQQAARAVLLGDAVHQAASEPLPFELPPPVPEVLNPSDAPVEPLSLRVPLECFYVRFGSFTNFLWLRHRLEDWGGEVRDIVSERGLDFDLNQRMQRQLGLRESKLAEMFGEKVIADVAMIGTDTFLREGAAIGILFQARNSAALNVDFTQQRSAAVKESAGGKLEKITIDDHPATFISTPDNSLRSFYVVDGDYHLVTTSRTLAEWFVATGAGKHLSLGSSEAFRLARKYMPLERNDTVFAYFSPSFFQNLLSPQYQVELRRRLRSSVEIELVRIARLASQSERRPAESIAELVAGGFLPESFGMHADGGHLEVNGATISDSLRGAPGSFLPVPDVPIERVTPAELAEYRQLAETYTTSWGAMDPIVAGIQRQPMGKELERVLLDVKAAPLSERHSKMLADWLGAPSDQRLARVAGDVVAFEAILRGNSLFRAQEHHLFGGLADADPTIAMNPNTGLIPQLFKSKLQGLQGYLGAWPNPGFLQMLSIFGESTPDAGGYSRSLTGVWRRQFDNFTLLSFQPEILARVSPQLRFEKAERPAQVWLHAEDLAKSQLAPMINAYGYRQSRQMALGNTRFMNMLVEQLHVPQADAMTVAETLLSARLLEPFGGKYELRELPGGQKSWVSTSVADHPSAKEPPAGYQMPALNWFRGIDLEVAMVDGLAALHGEVIMPVEARPAAGFSLPSLPFGKPAAAANLKNPKDSKDAAKPKPSLLKVPTLPAPAQPKASTKREF